MNCSSLRSSLIASKMDKAFSTAGVVVVSIAAVAAPLLILVLVFDANARAVEK